jgi:hypothetical protein
MPTIVRPHEIEAPDRFNPDDEDFDLDELFKVTSPEGTEEVYSPDEACDLILDLVEQQFWNWYDQGRALDSVSRTALRSSTKSCVATNRPRRFKPRVKIYEVWSPC